jgi:hypothetical protein
MSPGGPLEGPFHFSLLLFQFRYLAPYTNLQYFLYYSPPGWDPEAAWKFGMSPNITIDWAAEGDKLTLPVGLGVSRMVEIAGLPVNVAGEVYYSAIHPDDKPGSRWDARLYFTVVIPTFMF